MADRRGTADALCWWQVQVCRCVDSEQSACPSVCTVQRSTAALYRAQSDPVHQSTWASRSCHYISRLCVGVSCPHSQSRPGQHTQRTQDTSSAVTRARPPAGEDQLRARGHGQHGRGRGAVAQPRAERVLLHVAAAILPRLLPRLLPRRTHKLAEAR